jgi:hypothetical protein
MQKWVLKDWGLIGEKIMLPEEQELTRLEGEQSQLTEQVVSSELELETTKTETSQFQRRYYQTVGRLYVELDELEAGITRAIAEESPDDVAAQAYAQAAQKIRRGSGLD